MCYRYPQKDNDTDDTPPKDKDANDTNDTKDTKDGGSRASVRKCYSTTTCTS